VARTGGTSYFTERTAFCVADTQKPIDEGHCEVFAAMDYLL
jgi:hypothetical protein